MPIAPTSLLGLRAAVAATTAATTSFGTLRHETQTITRHTLRFYFLSTAATARLTREATRSLLYLLCAPNCVDFGKVSVFESLTTRASRCARFFRERAPARLEKVCSGSAFCFHPLQRSFSRSLLCSVGLRIPSSEFHTSLKPHCLSHMLESLVCLACVLGVSSKPRQPKASYVKVPQVPEPPSCGLAELLTKPTLSWPFETTDVAEAQFVGLAATVVREAAHGAWAYVDANQDGHLGIEELSKAVSESWVTSKASKRFQPKAGSWPFLYALAEEFGTKDLSRRAGICSWQGSAVVQ